MKFACLLLSLSPNDVAVVVPARQAYSHWALGREAELPALRELARLAGHFGEARQNASASAKFTLPTG